MSEDVRMLYVVLIRRAKKLLDLQLQQQWNVSASPRAQLEGACTMKIKLKIKSKT